MCLDTFCIVWGKKKKKSLSRKGKASSHTLGTTQANKNILWILSFITASPLHVHHHTWIWNVLFGSGFICITLVWNPSNVYVKHISYSFRGVIVYLDYPLCCKLRTFPFWLSWFPNAAYLLSCNRSASPPLLPILAISIFNFHWKWVLGEGQ